MSATSSFGSDTSVASGRRCQLGVEKFEGALDLSDRVERHTRVARRGRDVPVSQQILDHPDIDALFEQVGRKAVPQRMHGHRGIEAGDADRLAAGPLDGAHSDRALWVGSWKQQVLQTRSLPIGT